MAGEGDNYPGAIFHDIKAEIFAILCDFDGEHPIAIRLVSVDQDIIR